MKCPECGENHKRSLGVTCACGYEFVIDPKYAPDLAGVSAVDGLFRAIIRRASSNGTLQFTENQLFASAVRHVDYKRKNDRHSNVIAFVITLILTIVFLDSFIGIITGLIAAMLFFVILIDELQLFSPVKRSEWDKVVAMWRDEGGGAIPGLLESPRLEVPPLEEDDEQFYQQGFGRLLICQHRELVDLLVLNGFHTENSCIVISEDGYPDYVLPRVQKAIDENPSLQIFIWHDSGKTGEEMGRRLRCEESVLNVGDRQIIDLGLSAELISDAGRPVRRLNKAFAGKLPADGFPQSLLAGILGGAIGEYGELAVGAGEAAEGETVAFVPEVLREKPGVEETVSIELCYSVDWGCSVGDGEGDGE